MEYRQESVTTLHDFGAADPPAPLSRTAVVVPLTDRDTVGLAPERVLSSLQTLDVGSVVLPLRASADRVPDVLDWLAEFDLADSVLWCNAPAVEAVLEEVGLDGRTGKGRDVWLALGLAGEFEYVALHDADVRSHQTDDIRKLLAPLSMGYRFVKAYYARVENQQLFGRLYRLLVAPLLTALRETRDAEVLRYLDAFRYTLAGEMAMTGTLARSLRVPRKWGLEVGTLGEAYRGVGFEGTSQVDLGIYEHEHRSVSGPTGLSDMSHGVARALFRVLADDGYEIPFAQLRSAYRSVGDRYVDQYEADAEFNGYEYDPEAERAQVAEYAAAIEEPGPDDRLPTWADTPLSVETLERARKEALEAVQ